MKISFAVLAATLILAARLPAQAPAAPAAGTRARLVSASGAVVAEGRLVRLAPDSVVLTDGRRSQAYPLGGAARLQTVVGHRSNAGRGALLGGLIGVVIGGAAGASAGSQPAGTLEILPLRNAVSGAAILGFTGLALGGLIGALGSTEVWGPVPAGPPRD